MNAKPPHNLPPVRMGDRSDLVRRQKAKTKAQDAVAAKFRTKVYQDLLALLDIADRLTLDLSCHEDRYGLEWNSLARQIDAHYKADVVKIIPGLQALIMSKEGAQGLPKGLYRNLLDFVEECVAFLKWARSANGEGPADARSVKTSTAERQESRFMQACKRFKKACVEMQQQICIFENERNAGEASFFG